jgi:hypothetical protein
MNSASEPKVPYQVRWRKPTGDPEWTNWAWVDKNGTVYLPPVPDDESRLFARACLEEITVVPDSDHTYFPIWWLIREYPEFADLLLTVEKRVRAKVARFVARN